MRQLAVVFAALAIFGARPARAEDKAKAETYFHAGESAFRAQSFLAAAEQFELAYKEDPLPPIAFSAAQAYRKQYFVDAKPEYVKRAVELYRIYLDAVKEGHRVSDASTGLEEMKHELDRLTATGVKIAAIDTARTRLAVSVTIAGAQHHEMTEMSSAPATDDVHAKATVDGKPVELFTPIEIAAGDHTVEVTAEGYEPQTVKRRVVDGVTELVELELHPLLAHLAIASESDAQVTLNGRPVGTLPLPPQDLDAGRYLIGLTHRGRDAVVEQVELGRGEHKTVTVALHKTWRRRAVPWLGIAGGVLAAATVGSAVIAVHYDNEMQSIEHQRETVGILPADLASYLKDTSSRDQYRDAAWALGGVAVATGVVATLMYVFDTPAVGERAVVPTVGAAGGGVSVVGRF